MPAAYMPFAAKQDRPIIWTVSMSRLSDLFRDITLEYDDRAVIEPIQMGFDSAVQHIRRRLMTDRCDVLIAAGSNGAYLKSRLSLPVVIAKASGLDVMQALARARLVTEAIGVISYQQPLPELAEFKQAFGLPLVQRAYVTQEDARACVAAMKAEGVRAIVGTGLITDLAEEAGLTGIFVYSAGSIRQAFDDALELARLRHLEARNTHLARGRAGARVGRGLQDLRGRSEAMEAVRQTILLYARSTGTVLVQGETGTGKELAAQAIHHQSARSGQPFLAVNCGAVAESLLESELFGYEEGAFTGARRGGHPGLFEAARGGTLFLDEIGDMPLPLQTRLLRVLEEREVTRVGGTRPVPVDVRVVAATHCDLDRRMAEGCFRADLFYRLAVLRLELPPLRRRREDVLLLAEWHLRSALTSLGVARTGLYEGLEDCRDILEAYLWPGNVRELRNLMERTALHLAAQATTQPIALTPAWLCAVAPELQAPESSARAEASGIGQRPVELFDEGENLREVLARFKGNRADAARHLGISRTTLWRRMRNDGDALQDGFDTPATKTSKH